MLAMNANYIHLQECLYKLQLATRKNHLFIYSFLLYLTVIINKTKYFRASLARDWLAISAALLITCPNSVGPARETLKRALV